MVVKKSEVNIASFLGGVAITGIFLAGVLLAQTKLSTEKNAEEFKKVAEQVIDEKLSDLPKNPPEQTEYPDYFFATKIMKSITPISDQKGYVLQKTQEIVGSEEVTISSSGSIARGYLYIEAAVDNGRALTIYDSVYVKLNYVGGHLLRNKSLKVPTTTGTALLYPLNAVPYLATIPYDESRTGRTADWVNILNTTRNPVLLSFISTAREGGLIQKVMISYECTKESPNCSLSFTR